MIPLPNKQGTDKKRFSNIPSGKTVGSVIAALGLLMVSSACTQMNPVDAAYLAQRKYDRTERKNVAKPEAITVAKLLATARSKPSNLNSGTGTVGKTAKAVDLKIFLAPGAEQLLPDQVAKVRANLAKSFPNQDHKLQILSGPGAQDRRLNSLLIAIRRAKNVAQQIQVKGQIALLKYDPRLRVGELQVIAWPGVKVR